MEVNQVGHAGEFQRLRARLQSDLPIFRVCEAGLIHGFHVLERRIHSGDQFLES
jgi:hypothetical protein